MKSRLGSGLGGSDEDDGEVRVALEFARVPPATSLQATSVGRLSAATGAFPSSLFMDKVESSFTEFELPPRPSGHEGAGRVTTSASG